MAEQWIPYTRMTENGPRSYMIDVEHRGSADPARTTLTVAHVSMRDPEPAGVGSHDEANRLDDAFDGVTQQLPRLGAAFVARVRGGGRMSFHVYSAPSAAAEIQRLATQAFAGDEVGFERREDPSWELYQRLLPTRAEERPVLDAQVVQVLEQHGDPLTPKRDVRHFAYFPTEESARRFADAAKRDGFKVEITPPDDQAQLRVMASRDDSVTLESITPISVSLCEQARSCGGEYDGWEAALVQPQRKGLLSHLFGR